MITLETDYLYGKFQDLLQALQLNLLLLLSETSKTDIKEAVRYNIAYISVMLRLLNKKHKIPEEVNDLVKKELNLIRSLQPQVSTIFEYDVDFSQFKPRGHYTESEKLKCYFRAMMYAGRMSFVSEICNKY